MHVLILNQTFYPDIAATAQHMWDLARHLEARGHRVTAVASRTVYGTDRPAGPAFERMGRIVIHRVGGTAFGKRHLPGRLADFASFYVSAGWRLQQVPPPDVVLALSTPPMIAGLAMLQKQFRPGLAGHGGASAFVYHVMDLYPDAAVASGLLDEGSLLERTLGRVTGRTLQSADCIVALGRDMRERILSHYGRYVAADKVRIVEPWADGQELFAIGKGANPLAASLSLEQTFNIVYSGNLGIAHDLQTIIHAIDATCAEPQLRWIFIGGGKRYEDLRRQAEQRRWPHVRLLPYQERSLLNASLNLADVHLVSQLPAFTGVVVPSKLAGILAVGRPSIMVGPAEAECSRIIAEHGAGFVVANGDHASLLRSIRQLRDEPDLRATMGQKARQAFERRYDRSVACARLERLLLEACHRRQR